MKCVSEGLRDFHADRILIFHQLLRKSNCTKLWVRILTTCIILPSPSIKFKVFGSINFFVLPRTFLMSRWDDPDDFSTGKHLYSERGLKSTSFLQLIKLKAAILARFLQIGQHLFLVFFRIFFFLQFLLILLNNSEVNPAESQFWCYY